MDTFSASQENPHTENSFRIFSTQPIQPRLVRPTYSMGNLVGGQLDYINGLGHKKTLLSQKDVRRIEKSGIPTNLCLADPFRAFSQRYSTSDNNKIQPEIRRKELPKTEQPSQGGKSLDKAYMSDKEAADLEHGKESSFSCNKSLLHKRLSTTQAFLAPPLPDSEYSVSSLSKWQPRFS